MNELAINGGAPVRKEPWMMGSPFGPEEREAALRVLGSGRISVFRGGPEVRGFESEFAAYHSTASAIATTSGTTALHAALAALDLPLGSEVLVPAVTFISTASIVLQEGLVPIFVDIEPGSYCFDPVDARRKVSDRTRAMIPVHLFGHPARMDALLALAREYGLRVVEDCAQAHGAAYRGRKIGTFGDFGCFSFFQTKNMATGEGGMVVTADAALAKAVRMVRESGSPEDAGTWYAYERLGYNYNMTELQAAIGRVQLGKLDAMNHRRQENAACFRDGLRGTRLGVPREGAGAEHVYHNFSMLLPEGADRDAFVDAVRAENVPIDVCYPTPLYRTRLFADPAVRKGPLPPEQYPPYKDSDCPVSEDVTGRIVNVYTDPTLDEGLRADIVSALRKVSAWFYGYEQ